MEQITSQIAEQISIVNVVLLVGVDFILGVLLALKNKKFDIDKLPATLSSNVLPYVGGLLVLDYALARVSGLDLAVTVAIVAYGAKVVASVVGKTRSLFGV